MNSELEKYENAARMKTARKKNGGSLGPKVGADTEALIE